MRYWAYLPIAVLAAALTACQNPSGAVNDLPSVSFPPTGYEVSGAGSSEVDGYYTATGTFDGNPLYSQSGGSCRLFNYWAGTGLDIYRRWQLNADLPSNIPALTVIPYYGPEMPTSPEAPTSYTAGSAASPGPTVLRMPISGSTAVGSTLTAHYIFSDPQGDADASTFQWQRSIDGSSGWADIFGATSLDYSVDLGDANLWLRIQVIPADDLGDIGTTVVSQPLKIGSAGANNPPSASFAPAGYQVSGAGSVEVDGYYTETSTFDSDPLYSQSGGSYLLFNYFAGTDPNIFRHWQLNTATPILGSPPELNTIPYYGPADPTSPEGTYTPGSKANPGPMVLRMPISGNTAVGNSLMGHTSFRTRMSPIRIPPHSSGSVRRTALAAGLTLAAPLPSTI
jgi:hypothetical protein